jgi:hypothetical protein
MTCATETAFLALADVAPNVDIIAMPELQGLGSGPNGTGPDLQDLIRIHGHQLFGANTSTERKVVLTYMKEDWNHRWQKSRGRWNAQRTAWRKASVKAFLNHLWVHHPGVCKEIVIVGHGSFFNLLVDNPRSCRF